MQGTQKRPPQMRRPLISSYLVSGPVISPRTVRWGGTLLPQAIGRAMEWPDSCPKRKLSKCDLQQFHRHGFTGAVLCRVGGLGVVHHVAQQQHLADVEHRHLDGDAAGSSGKVVLRMIPTAHKANISTESMVMLTFLPVFILFSFFVQGELRMPRA